MTQSGSLIYILEDERNIRSLIKTALEREQYIIREFEDVESFYAGLSKEIPDLVLMDILLPGGHGLAVLKKIREDPDTQFIPVIFLTAIDNEQTIALGLDLGADDCITDPLRVLELRSRIRALLRRSSRIMQRTKAEVFDVGSLHVETARHLVTVRGEPVVLSLKEYELLVMLLMAGGEVCCRKDLLAEVWGKSYGESRTLDVHIRRLRSKLKDAGPSILTVKGVGYKLDI